MRSFFSKFKSKSKYKNFLIVFALVFAVFAFVGAGEVLAQIDTSLGDFQEASQLGDQDIKVTIAKIVRVVLGFLGILAILIVLYGGFIWMTAGGNEDKILLAKKILKNGLIGLMIIILSFSITQFVLSSLGDATGTQFSSSDSDSSGGGGGGTGGTGGGGSIKNFTVQSIVPSGNVPIYNVSVKINFSMDVDSESVEKNIILRKTGSSKAIDVDYDIDDSMVAMKSAKDCGTAEATGCLDRNTQYVVDVKDGKNGVLSKDGKKLKCGLGSTCSVTFTTGDKLDLKAPSVEITSPDEGAMIPKNSNVTIGAKVDDDVGVGLVEFFVENEKVGFKKLDYPIGLPTTVSISFDTGQFSNDSEIAVKAIAYDFDGHKTESDEIKLSLAPEHCFDGIKTADTDEIGIDCSPDGGDCGKCKNSGCDKNSDCASGVCSTPAELPQKLLDNSSEFSKWEVGSGFVVKENKLKSPSGDLTGAAVEVLESQNNILQKVFSQKTQGNTFTFTLWLRKILSRSAPREVSVVFSNLLDRGTYDEAESKKIEVTNQWVKYSITKTFEKPAEQLRLHIGCDECERGESFVLYGADLSWDKTKDTTNTEVKKCVELPTITEVSPRGGGAPNWVTIFGKYFGEQGTVSFIDEDGKNIKKFTASKAQCAGNSSWTDNMIIVEVPQNLVLDKKYPIEVKNQFGEDRTDDDRGNFLPEVFQVKEGDSTAPGLCSVSPPSDKPDSLVQVFGKNLSIDAAKQYIRIGGQTAIMKTLAINKVGVNVPNMSVGNYLVEAEVNGKKSNPVPFEVLGEGAKPAPSIISLSDERGPVGQYITITGKNFGKYKNLVKFISLTPDLVPTDLVVLGDFEFPEMCSKLGTWSDASIIVKVPQAASGNYHLLVSRNDSDNDPNNNNSNSIKFEIIDGVPKPGLCALAPDNGPEKLKVTLHGKNFGTEKGKVSFGDLEASVDANDWYEDVIYTTVPMGATSGPVKIKNASALTSNEKFFTIKNCNEDKKACTEDEQCCGDGACIPKTDTDSGDALKCGSFNIPVASYTYSFFTGKSSPNPNNFPPTVIEECTGSALPSPSPWEDHPGGTSVCKSVPVGVKFSIPIDQTTLKLGQGVNSSMLLYKCEGDEEKGEEVCGVFNDNPVDFVYQMYIGNGGAYQSYLANFITQNFAPNTWYMGVLKDTITGLENGMSMVPDGTCEGTPAELAGGAYCFKFKTHEDGTDCKLGGLVVSPSEFTVDGADGLQENTSLIMDPKGEYLVDEEGVQILDEEGKKIRVYNPLAWNVMGVAKESNCFLYDNCFGFGSSMSWGSDNESVVIPKKVVGANSCQSHMKVTGESKEAALETGSVSVVPAVVTATHLQTKITDDALIFVDYGAPQVMQQCGSGMESPSPWVGHAGGEEICKNAIVNVVFSQKMDANTFSNSNFYVQKCIGKVDQIGEDGEEIPGEVDHECEALSPMLGSLVQTYVFDDTKDGAILKVVGAAGGMNHIGFDPDTWYRVGLNNGLKNTNSIPMEINTSCDVARNESYCYIFKTRESKELCKVESVEVNPNRYTASSLGWVSETLENGEEIIVEYKAEAKPENSCVVLDSSYYQWTWEVSDEDYKYVEFYDDLDGYEGQKFEDTYPEIVVDAKAETPANTPATILASVKDKVGKGELSVKVKSSEISSYYPFCSAVCVNAQVGIEFDKPVKKQSIRLNSSTFNPAKAASILVLECENESCLFDTDENGLLTKEVESLKLPYTLQVPNYWVTNKIILNGYTLPPNKYHRVLVLLGENGLISKSGVGIPITSIPEESRYPLGENSRYFSWVFKSKNNTQNCEISEAGLVPVETVVSGPGIVRGFEVEARGSVDNCNPTEGQLLDAGSYDWSWSVLPSSVAQLVGGKESKIKTLKESPYCTDSCLAKGSQPKGTSVCGNKVLEPGENCDDGNIRSDDGCSSICLNEGADSPNSVCGDGEVQYMADLGGEDCDGGEGCSEVCTWLGSNSTVAECGNKDVGIGEECDDADPEYGMYCSGCLWTGTPPSYTACNKLKSEDLDAQCVGVAVCGNGINEPGEDLYCDGFVKNNLENSCSEFCVMEGRGPKQQGDADWCGNGEVEIAKGESCDDGNIISGDGCSSTCLLEGSSAQRGSFCGDGTTQFDEASSCEKAGAYVGVSASNHIQYITGLEGGDVVDNKRTAEVKASTSLPFAVGSVDAEGKYVIQCGFTSDAQCGDVNTLGVGNDACCYGRPNVISEKPISSGVCRNTMMTAEFNEKIYPNSLTDNVSVYIKTNTEEACTKAGGTVTQKFTKNINDPWYRRAWLSVVNFVREMLDVEPAYALFDCEGVVDFEIQLADAQEIIEGKVVNRSKLFIIPTEVLKANTTYYVNLGKDIKNEKSISMHQDKSWQFTTGLEVCDIDRVSVEPGKYVFFVPGIEGAGNFIAIAETVINGVAQPLIQTNDYEWEWSWLVSNETIAQIENVSDDGDVVIVSALPNKGSAILRATATITHDTFFNPSTVENEYYGIAELTNTMCENPWPEYQNSQFPLIDSSHNFSTWYCRGNGTQDLLPGLTKGQLVSTADDPNLLKAFFLQNQDNGDAIGVRVQKNLKHLSPMDWYNEQGFPGNPEVIEIDGYQAIVDGATIYISAVNVATENNNHKLTPGSNDKGKFNERYTNIYIISHNDTASAETKIIYKQLIDNLEFNVNLNKEWDQGVCASIKESKKAYNILQPEIQCTSELECLAEAPTAEEKIIPGSEEYIDCLSVKKQMQRDMVRLSDLQKIKQAVEIYKMQNTNAPLLQQGTYIPSMSVSAWDSWQAQLGSVLGIEMPLDPLNEFRIGCAESGANSENCWNSGSQQYQCMKRSHVYAYQSTEGGLEYKLKAELESSGPNDWKGIDLSEFDLVETCTDITSTFIGAGGVCGDGILNPSMGEQCEIGMKASYGSCVYSDASSVEYPGTFVIQCPNDCKYLPESQVNCQPTGFCGDGVLNGGEVCDNASFNGAYNNCSLDCLSEISAYGACGDGIIQENQGEVCDVWGNRCAFTNRTCSVGSESVDCEKVVDIYYKTVDGKQMVIVGVYSAGDDKVVSFVMPVEDLPAGIKTSDPEPCLKEQVQTVHASSKSESCNWDCKAFGPYCGDRLINGGEECDGDPIISETLNINVIEWCAPGKDKAYLIKGCTSDCKIEKSTDWECSETDPNAEVVYAPPPPTPPVPEKICGDASLQPEIGEECDNGVSNGNICSALYNSSCIYCSNTCKKITLTGGSCGDGVRQAQESCDNEDMSGVQCTDFGFTGGDLQCAPDCSFDKINCSI